MTRIFKPDSGQTLEIQDEGGSVALTIDTDGDIQIANNIDTGTFNGALSASTTGGGLMSVGTVSESSGTPTGDIIERGSNANGGYVRYADGTQICTLSSKGASSSVDTTWTFPIAFKSGSLPVPAGSCDGTQTDPEDRVATTGASAVTNTAWVFRVWNVGADPVARSAYQQQLSAIGRWF